MFLYRCLPILAVLPITRVIGGQIPVVDGVIGGVSNNTSFVEPQVLRVAATTPGKLRVVQNSGICGNLFRNLFRSTRIKPLPH